MYICEEIMMSFAGVVSKLRKLGKDNCVSCHKEIGSFSSYDHPNGIEMMGFAAKQWFYGTCSDKKCRYESALWKMLA